MGRSLPYRGERSPTNSPTRAPRLALAELAGAAGLVVGLGVAPIGIAAAVGVIACFVGAVITHVKAGDKNIAPPAALGVVAVVALVLRLATT